MGAGLGDADVDEAMAFSGGTCVRDAEAGIEGGGMSLAGCTFIGCVLLDGLRAWPRGDAERGGALNG